MKQICLALIVALLLLTISYSQTPSPTVTPILSSQPQNSGDTEKIAVLQAQLELMRQYEERLLSTVYWSLGAIGGVVLLVVGLGWYTNFRIYKRDLEEVKREVRDDIDKVLSKIKGDIDTELSSIKTSLRSEMLDEMRKAIDSSVGSATRELKRVQYQMLKLEAERWESTEVFINALLTYSEMIKLAVELHASLYMPEILEHMLRILKNKEVIFNAGATAAIMKSLDEVPKEYSADVDAINQLIRSLRAK